MSRCSLLKFAARSPALKLAVGLPAVGLPCGPASHRLLSSRPRKLASDPKRRRPLASFRHFSSSPTVALKKAWGAMTLEQQRHWKLLGWSPLSWHSLAPAPASASTEFKALSLAQMKVAVSLGYDEASWDGHGDDPFVVSRQAWAAMPREQQRHWSTLGWTSTSWDEQMPTPPRADKPFKALGLAQVQAAVALGYDEASWNTRPPTLPGAGLRKMFTTAWDDLAEDARENWTKLGWSGASWNNNGPLPPSSAARLRELNPEEQAAALCLGYTEATWGQKEPHVPAMSGQVGTSLPRELRLMKTIDWHAMSHLDQERWAVLGWTQCSWDDDSSYSRPETATMDFDKMSPRQQTAARGLGYTQASWDADEATSAFGVFFSDVRVQGVAGVAAVIMAAFVIGSEAWEAASRRAAAEAQPGGTTHLSRQPETPRRRWRSLVEANGLTFAELPGVNWAQSAGLCTHVLPLSWQRRLGLEECYWNERASYRLSDEGAWRIEAAAFELHSMLLEATDEVVRSDVLMREFGVPPALWAAIRSSWERRDGDLVGRFDLLWDGEGEPKLAEYNADTPTVLVEAAAAQREWCRAVHPDKGQFNVLDEALQASWLHIITELTSAAKDSCATERPQPSSQLVYQPGHGGLATWQAHGQPLRGSLQITFAAQGCYDRIRITGSSADGCSSFGGVAPRSRHWAGLRFEEEESTAVFMASRAAKAAEAVKAAGGPAVDIVLRCIDELQADDLLSKAHGGNSDALWKLYPWEWLIHEQLGAAYCSNEAPGPRGQWWSPMQSDRPEQRGAPVFEPPWKLLMSSKAMLAYLVCAGRCLDP